MIGIEWGSTSVSVEVFIRDVSVTTKVVGLTGVVASDVGAAYWRPNDTAPTSITMTALGSLGAAYVSGGWLAINATTMPGRYRFDLPNGMVASGAFLAGLCLRSAGTGFSNGENVNAQYALLAPIAVASSAVNANVTFINGTAVSATGGIPDVNVKNVGNTAVVATAGLLNANLTQVLGTAPTATAGVLDVNVKNVGNTAVVATAGRVDANLVRINNTAVVATAGLIDANVAQILNTAAPATAGRLDVNVARVLNTAIVATAGVIDANAITLGTAAQTSVRTEARTSVDASISTAFNTTTRAALTAVPSATAAVFERIDWLFERARNQMITNATSVKQYSAAGASYAAASLAGDTVTGTRGNFV